MSDTKRYTVSPSLTGGSMHTLELSQDERYIVGCSCGRKLESDPCIAVKALCDHAERSVAILQTWFANTDAATTEAHPSPASPSHGAALP